VGLVCRLKASDEANGLTRVNVAVAGMTAAAALAFMLLMALAKLASAAARALASAIVCLLAAIGNGQIWKSCEV